MENVSSNKQSRLSGAVAVTIAQAIVLFLGFITHPVIGKLLGSEQYGIYGVVLSAQTILGVFLTLGIPSAVSRFVAQDEQHARDTLRQALKLQTYASLSLGAAAAVAAPIIARLLNDPSLTPYFLFVPVILITQAFYPIFAQFFNGLHIFNRQAILTTVYAIAKLAGAISLLFVFQIYGAFAGFAIGGIVAALLGWYWSQRVPSTGNHPLPIKTFLTFAGSYVFVLAGLQLLMSVDLFMVKSILQDNDQAGYYNAATTLARISYMLLQGTAFIILPSVSALTKPGTSHDEAAVFIKDTLRYLVGLIIPSVTFAAATSKQLILLFYSDSYLPAAPALTILMIGLGALAFYLLVNTILAGAGKTKIGLITTGSLILASLGLGTILIPQFGLIGAAYQTTIVSLIGLAILSTYTFRTFAIPVPVRSTINIIIATAAAVLPTYVWTVSRFLLPLQYIVLFLIYGGILYLLREIGPRDIERVTNLHPALARFRPKPNGY